MLTSKFLVFHKFLVFKLCSLATVRLLLFLVVWQPFLPTVAVLYVPMPRKLDTLALATCIVSSHFNDQFAWHRNVAKFARRQFRQRDGRELFGKRARQFCNAGVSGRPPSTQAVMYLDAISPTSPTRSAAPFRRQARRPMHCDHRCPTQPTIEQPQWDHLNQRNSG